METSRPPPAAATVVPGAQEGPTRRTLQAEALRLFAQQGFQTTTIEEIAAAVEVAPRTYARELVRHFSPG
jgi:AcrR family transcriptional regulator